MLGALKQKQQNGNQNSTKGENDPDDDSVKQQDKVRDTLARMKDWSAGVASVSTCTITPSATVTLTATTTTTTPNTNENASSTPTSFGDDLPLLQPDQQPTTSRDEASELQQNIPLLPRIPTHVASTLPPILLTAGSSTPFAFGNGLFNGPIPTLDSLLAQHGLDYPSFIAYLNTPDLRLCFCEFIIKTVQECPPFAMADALKMLKKIAYITVPRQSSSTALPASRDSGISGGVGGSRTSTASSLSEFPQIKTIAEAQFLLATCYQSGLMGLSEDPDRAFQLYVMASKNCHPEALYRKGVCLELGSGTRKDAQLALSSYENAAMLGNTHAMFRLSMLLLYKGCASLDVAVRGSVCSSISSPQEIQQGMKWLSAAVLKDDVYLYPTALFELGLIYEGTDPKVQVLCIPPNQEYALDLFFRAAQYGFSAAQVKLATSYERGLLGLPLDFPRALAWYSKAAELGDCDAEVALSGWYLCGIPDVLTQSDINAYLWARKAAEKGSANAEYAVGYFYEHGIGTAKSVELAKKYYLRASANGNPKAISRVQLWLTKEKEQKKKGSGCSLM